jgi:hypothetical protein
MKLLIILIFVVTSSFGSSIDTILKKSEVSKNATDLQGFFIHRHQSHPVSHDSLKSFQKSMMGPWETAIAIDTSMANRLTKLEESNAKISLILENLQSQSDDQKDNSNFIIKLMESIAGILGALGTFVGVIFAVYKWLKSNSFRKLNSPSN